jgi:hypothetical protein
VTAVCGDLRWGTDHLILREYAFAADIGAAEPVLSSKHTEYAWHTLDGATEALEWDSNVTAAWETSERIRLGVW